MVLTVCVLLSGELNKVLFFAYYKITVLYVPGHLKRLCFFYLKSTEIDRFIFFKCPISTLLFFICLVYHGSFLQASYGKQNWGASYAG